MLYDEKSRSMSDAESHIFQYGLVPLRLKNVTTEPPTVLWCNTSPNSALYCRPIYLVREIETNDELTAEVMTKMDTVVDLLHTRGIRVTYNDGTVNVQCKLFDSMKDLKYKKHLSGCGGADCILCKTKQVDWTNAQQVIEGFPINRDARGNEDLYHSLVNDDGEIPRAGGDFELRQGLTSKPLTSSDQRNITITHSYINGTTFFLKFLVRIHIDYKNWVERKDYRGLPLQKAKQRVQATIKQHTGLAVDECASTGHGGTSTDGNTGRRFFSSELRPVLEELIPDKYKENALLLHVQLSAVLRLVSCTEKLDMIKYKELCKQIGLNLANNFPWVRLNHTLHGTV